MQSWRRTPARNRGEVHRQYRRSGWFRALPRLGSDRRMRAARGPAPDRELPNCRTPPWSDGLDRPARSAGSGAVAPARVRAGDGARADGRHRAPFQPGRDDGQLLLGAVQAPDAGAVRYANRDDGVADVVTLPEPRRRRLARTEWGLVHQNPRDGLPLGASA